MSSTKTDNKEAEVAIDGAATKAKKTTTKKTTSAATKKTAKATAKADEEKTVKKTAAKKATAAEKKPAAKKAPAKKAASTKTAIKKEEDGKTAAAKDTEKKTVEKKATAKKTAEKKTAAKRPAAKKSTPVVEEKQPLRVLMVASEAEPFISTGGMGQVVGALPKELKNVDKELDIRVVIPLYSEVEARFRSIINYIGNGYVTLAWRSEYCGVFEANVHGVTYYFVDNKRYFNRERCYGYYDDAERFSYFSKSVFHVMEIAGFYPDVIHCNDWQTALVPVFLKTRFAGRYDNIRTVFTIHNMEYQGRYGLELLGDVFDLADWEASLVEFEKDINLMKGAIQCCDQLTTVSPTYAGELQDNLGCGMQQLIRENNYKLTGILNGIDTQSFDPTADMALSSTYDAKSLDKKLPNKLDLQEMFGMERAPRRMMITMVSRLVPHKGIDLLTYIMEDMINSMDVNFIMLGSGDHQYELLFEELAGRYHGRIGVSIAYNPVIARKIYAGSDLMLVPSRSEPCGLTQMIACRYGAIPVVRSTGGLRDSIQDCRGGEGNGFVFTGYSSYELLDTIRDAYNLYKKHEEDWNNLVKYAMGVDFSWKKSAQQYREVYGRISM